MSIRSGIAFAGVVLTALLLLVPGNLSGRTSGREPAAPPTPPLNLTLSGSGAILLGTPAVFWANGTGGWPPYHFTWFLNGTPISANVSFPTGATSRLDFLPAGNGIYAIAIVLNDSHGNSTSQRSLLHVTGPSPIAVSLKVVGESSDGGFVVAADPQGGTPPYTFRWEGPGAPSGFTNSSQLAVPGGGNSTVRIVVIVRDHLGFAGQASLTVHRSVTNPYGGLAGWELILIGALVAFGLTLAVVYLLARRRRRPPAEVSAPPG